LKKAILTTITLTSLLSLVPVDTQLSRSDISQNIQTQLPATNQAQADTMKELDWKGVFQYNYPDVDLGDGYNAADAGCSWGSLTVQLMRSGMSETIDGAPMQMDNLINSLRARGVSQTAFVVDYTSLNAENSSQFFPEGWVVADVVNPNIPLAIDSSDSNSLQGLTLEERRQAIAWGEERGYKMILLYEGEFGHYLSYIDPETVADTGGFYAPGETSKLVDDLSEDNGRSGVYSLMAMSHITYLDIYKK